MIRITNIVQSGHIAYLNTPIIRIYEVTLQYQDALGISELVYQFREDEISAANIIHLIKHIYQDEYKVQEKIDRLNKEIQELEP